jgi:transporter family protein
MGATTSKNHPATMSPTASFGRLRVHSPRVSAIVRDSIRASQRAQQGAGEKTSLLRHLESLDIAGEEEESPAFLLWIGPALICAMMYALYNIFIKKGSASIHPILGGVILQFIAALFGSILLGILVAKDGADEMNYDMEGIKWSILAGGAVGAAEILSFIVSGMGVQAMQSIPIIIGGSVLFGTTLGATVLKEVLTARGWFGVGLIAAGISLVGIDPGGAGSVH